MRDRQNFLHKRYSRFDFSPHVRRSPRMTFRAQEELNSSAVISTLLWRKDGTHARAI